MSTYNGLAGYQPAYDPYEDEQIDPENMHPTARHQARKIVYMERKSLLMKWWISLAGVISVITCFTSLVLASFDLVIQAGFFAGISAMTSIYLVSLAHRAAMRC